MFDVDVWRRKQLSLRSGKLMSSSIIMLGRIKQSASVTWDLCGDGIMVGKLLHCPELAVGLVSDATKVTRRVATKMSSLNLSLSLGCFKPSKVAHQNAGLPNTRDAEIVMAQSYTAILSIYAELLSNIRQVSVRATLSSPSDSTTKAEILDDGRRIQVRHQGEVRALELPSRVLARSSIPIPEKSSQDLAWRLPVPVAETELTRFSAENQSVPWSSTNIQIGSCICCRQCDSVVVPRGRITSWKDLPSENWAEMMEFWHCHKPHEHEHHHNSDEALSKRGYGANSAITAQPEVGFVDLTSFMFSEPDCDGLLVSLLPVPHLVLCFPGRAGKEKVA